MEGPMIFLNWDILKKTWLKNKAEKIWTFPPSNIVEKISLHKNILEKIHLRWKNLPPSASRSWWLADSTAHLEEVQSTKDSQILQTACFCFTRTRHIGMVSASCCQGNISSDWPCWCVRLLCKCWRGVLLLVPSGRGAPPMNILPFITHPDQWSSM